MMANKMKTTRDFARDAYDRWEKALGEKWSVTLTIRGRGSTGDHKNYKAGKWTRVLTLRGSLFVRSAFEDVLELCEAGGIDFDD